MTKTPWWLAIDLPVIVMSAILIGVVLWMDPFLRPRAAQFHRENASAATAESCRGYSASWVGRLRSEKLR